MFIITATARTHHMGRLADFAQQERYALVDQLAASLKEVEGKYTDQNGNFSYDLALASHVRKHAPLFNAVSFALESLEPGNDEGTEEGGLCSETLLSRQKRARSSWLHWWSACTIREGTCRFAAAAIPPPALRLVDR